MRKALALALTTALATAPLAAQDKEEQRLHECGTVLKEILDIPDNIPQDLLDRAECVIVIPSTKKGAIGIGGSYGRGAMSCRSGDAFQGPWGAPSMYALEGLNIGFQLGGEAIDYVLLIMNKRGANSVLKSKTKLGADASATAGPKGRTATAATDAFMRSEILSYSRTRGLFAGISLEGSTLRADNGANQKIYRRKIPARQIVLGGTGVPAAGARFVSYLNQKSPRNLSEDK
jgi:lipid-binding SYLF domain-containing protein